jgi:WD40 repeat protein
VIDTASNSKKVLKHAERVRSLIWNTEIPWLLISGSDDSVINVWDTRNSKLISSTCEPILATTSLTSHADKPFSIISSHFDSSIVFWSLLSIPEISLA